MIYDGISPLLTKEKDLVGSFRVSFPLSFTSLIKEIHFFFRFAFFLFTGTRTGTQSSTYIFRPQKRHNDLTTSGTDWTTTVSYL